ncbi:MAG: hypothetical protein SGJ11_17870 [Phycisphaerae bacterium]|nr:hypothetical protein [Phycisphaerae bacterium]
MFLRSNRTLRRLSVLGLCALIGAAVGMRADDPLEGYLERLRLTRLLADYLEQELSGHSLPEQRAKLVDRLAEVYPELLEQEPDAVKRDALVARSTAFLERENPKLADGLRLALLRARYRAAARTGEDFRAALADDAAVADAIKTLKTVEEETQALRARIELRLKDLERRGERFDGIEGERAEERANQVRGQVQEAVAVMAWSMYYRSLLTDDRHLAESAQPLFARVLDTGELYPSPNDVSKDLRANEFFANAILGMALAKSRTESLSTVLAWLALLDEVQVPDSLRKQLPAWRLVACIERSEWLQARDVLRTMASDRDAPAAWLRLAAVGGLRNRDAVRDATNLARKAIAGLAARRELTQIADLARRFGDAAIGTDGFASAYVRGVLAYERGREAKEAKQTSEAAAAFADASKHLERAVTEPDAEEFTAAVAACRLLAGWARFERDDFAAAYKLFAEASERGGGRDDESDWMTLVTLEKLIPLETNTAKRAAFTEELRGRLDRYLTNYPASERVPDLLVRRMALMEVPLAVDLERLLAMDDTKDGAPAAKRQAVAGLYRKFRASTDEARVAAGRRFIEEAERLAKTGGVGGMHPDLPGGDITIARQALEVALAPEIADAEYAQSLLATIDALGAAQTIDVSTFSSELSVRRVQLELIRHDLAQAVARLAELEAAIRDDIGRHSAELARRHIYRYAAARLKSPSLPSGAADRGAIVDATLRSADAILAAAEVGAASIDTVLADSVNEGVAVVFVQAAAESVERDGGGDLGERAMRVARALLERRPRDPLVLEAAAAIARSVGETELALDSLRQLVAGSGERSDRWFRAKIALIELLATLDIERGRAVMAQHRQLHPDYGPAPWGDLLRALEKELGAGPEAPPEEGAA